MSPEEIDEALTDEINVAKDEHQVLAALDTWVQRSVEGPPARQALCREIKPIEQENAEV